MGKTLVPHPLLLARLELLRELIDSPITINSGVRCPAHNKAIGGAPHSKHLAGEAADITCAPSHQEAMKAHADKLFENGGMGTAKHWCHVDVGAKRRWTYPD